MKKKILLLMGIFSLGLLQAQVGINTQNPLGIFHIDTNGNTTGTAAAPVNDVDDLIVNADGRVGVGTVNPQVTMDINGDVRYRDGNEFAGALLRSDANGNASWSEVRGLNKMILPNEVNAETIMRNMDLVAEMPVNATVNANGVYHYTGVSITLPEAAKWKVFIKAAFEHRLVGNFAYYITWSLGRSTSSFATLEGHVMSSYSGINNYGNVITTAVPPLHILYEAPSISQTSGTYVLEVTGPTTYYLWQQVLSPTIVGIAADPTLNNKTDNRTESTYVHDSFALWAVRME